LEKCFNCNNHKKTGCILVKQGASFFICDDCDPFDIPDWKVNQEAETWVSRNIRRAKILREAGLSPWNRAKDTAISS
jgi:hypothetical protein